MRFHAKSTERFPVAGTSEIVSQPGRSRGIFDVSRYRYLLDLLVQKEVRVRYRGSWLGMVWTYVKPLTQFIVFYVAMGIFLGIGRGGGIQNYPVYLFAGIIVTNFFTEAFMSGTMSVVSNAGLIKKIYMPRELFPLASLRVSLVHFFPQWLVLVVGSILLGWKADLVSIRGIKWQVKFQGGRSRYIWQILLLLLLRHSIVVSGGGQQTEALLLRMVGQ